MPTFLFLANQALATVSCTFCRQLCSLHRGNTLAKTEWFTHFHCFTRICTSCGTVTVIKRFRLRIAIANVSTFQLLLIPPWLTWWCEDWRWTFVRNSQVDKLNCFWWWPRDYKNFSGCNHRNLWFVDDYVWVQFILLTSLVVLFWWLGLAQNDLI